MIKIRSYKTGDTFKINIKPKAFIDNDVVAMAMSTETLYPWAHKNYTILWNDKPLAVIHYEFSDNNSVILEALIGKEVEDHGLAFARAMKRWWTIESHANEIKNVSTTLRSTYPEGRTWLKFLGLERKEVLKNHFENGVDCEIWETVEA